MSVYRRHLRHSSFDRVRHGKNLQAFLAEQADRLSVAGSPITVTFTNGTNQVNAVAHGLTTGDGSFNLSNSGGALPAGLSSETAYWVNVKSVDAVTLHLSEGDAIADTDGVAFTTDGTGTTTLGGVTVSPSEVFELLKTHTAEQVEALVAFPA